MLKDAALCSGVALRWLARRCVLSRGASRKLEVGHGTATTVLLGPRPARWRGWQAVGVLPPDPRGSDCELYPAGRTTPILAEVARLEPGQAGVRYAEGLGAALAQLATLPVETQAVLFATLLVHVRERGSIAGLESVFLSGHHAMSRAGRRDLTRESVDAWLLLGRAARSMPEGAGAVLMDGETGVGTILGGDQLLMAAHDGARGDFDAGARTVPDAVEMS